MHPSQVPDASSMDYCVYGLIKWALLSGIPRIRWTLEDCEWRVGQNQSLCFKKFSFILEIKVQNNSSTNGLCDWIY